MHLLPFTFEELLWWSPKLKAPFLHLKARFVHIEVCLDYPLELARSLILLDGVIQVSSALAVSNSAQVLNEAYHCNSLICTSSKKCFEIQPCNPQLSTLLTAQLWTTIGSLEGKSSWRKNSKIILGTTSLRKKSYMGSPGYGEVNQRSA